MSDSRLWHGGVSGLRVGDILRPGHARKQHDGCPYCVARAKGETVAGIDPPSAKQAVYITSDKEYARFYASLWGYGDLYVVEPIGPIEPSPEDHLPAWTCESARVVAVYQRAIQLTWTQRRALLRRWKVADEAALARKSNPPEEPMTKTPHPREVITPTPPKPTEAVREDSDSREGALYLRPVVTPGTAPRLPSEVSK